MANNKKLNMQLNSFSQPITKRKQYNTELIQTALHSITNDGKSIYSASKEYNIPKSTLKNEIKICDWIIECAQKGDPRTKDDLIQAAIKYDIYENKNPRFGKNGPSKKWLKNFLIRHPNVTFRKPEQLSKASATVTSQDIDIFFQVLEKWFIDNGHQDLFLHAERWFNLDESCFDLNSTPDRVLAPKGAKTVYSVNSTNLHDNITTTFCFSANGSVWPVQVLFNKTFSKLEEVSYAAGETGKKFWFAKTEKGWQTKESFLSYFEKIDEELTLRKIQRPVVFCFDGHASHDNIDLFLYCKERDIIIVKFPPNATNILQMADTSIFAPTKKNFRSEVTKYKHEYGKINLSHGDFIKILSRVMDKTMTADLIKNGFRGTGIFPFNRKNVHDDRLIGTVHQHTSLNDDNTLSNIPVINNSQNIKIETQFELMSLSIDIIQDDSHVGCSQNFISYHDDHITNNNEGSSTNDKTDTQIIDQQLKIIIPTNSNSISQENCLKIEENNREPILLSPAEFSRKGVKRLKKPLNYVMTADEVVEQRLADIREKEKILKEKEERKAIREQNKLIRENNVKIKKEMADKRKEIQATKVLIEPKKRGRKPKSMQQN
ncbi:hypothetical protein PVAND_004216 [Polypedilum vanderplanki]|uniref:HTH CENPB-type domain-containing protein n=1 Tax=Polypedilum vanderplanki TaxID=319348 RepID=A0A9J6BWG7_POLVA|nr:hypothetical protein PVAND_004216 [Polypedilum vanderplanki]